jgi:hypothetical protein
MAFTDRFLKIPIEVFNIKEKDLTGKENCIVSYTKILPFEIAEYRPTYDADNTDVELTSIALKNGDRFCCVLTVKEFEKLIDGFVQ